MSAQEPAVATARQGLIRGLGLREATAANVVEMVGMGPFITIPLLISAMNGPQALLGWFCGALLAICDGVVWAELGTAMPGAGGSYLYLRQAFGHDKLGRMMSFLFVWTILFTTPLSAASGAVGFAEYLRYLIPGLSAIAVKLCAVGVVFGITALAYRDIRAIGRLSFVLMVVVIGCILWVILSGIFRVKLSLLALPPHALSFSKSFLWGLGQASLIAIYDEGGYNNVCYLSGEVKDPSRNVPRAVILSIAMVALLYFFMTFSILGVVPWQKAALSQHVVSDYIEIIYGAWAGKLLTVLILGAAFASIFALLVGQSRIPYAAAVDGEFFRPFARLHPKGRFPSVAVVTLGLGSALFCFVNLDQIIQILIAVQLVVPYLAQTVAVALIRRRRDIERPFKMWLYPLPSVVAATLWVFVLISTGWRIVTLAMGVLVFGIGLYLARARHLRHWPFVAD